MFHDFRQVWLEGSGFMMDDHVRCKRKKNVLHLVSKSVIKRATEKLNTSANTKIDGSFQVCHSIRVRGAQIGNDNTSIARSCP